MGILMLSVSIFGLANTPSDLLNLGIVPGFVNIFIYRMHERLRERITYPRIGYVKPRKAEIDSYAIGIVGFIFLLYIVITALHVLLVGSPFDLEVLFRYAPLYIGVGMILPSLWLVKAMGNRNYSLFGALASITGLVFTIAGSSDSRLGFVLYTLLWGIIVTVAGISKLVSFIKNNPILEISENAISE